MKTLTVEDFKNQHYTHPCGDADSLTNKTFLDLLSRFTDGVIYANIEVDPDDIESDTELFDLSFNIVNFNTLTHEDVKKYITELVLDEDDFADMFDINTSHIPFNKEYYINDGTILAQALIAHLIECSCGMRVETMKDVMNVHPDIQTNTYCESE